MLSVLGLSWHKEVSVSQNAGILSKYHPHLPTCFEAVAFRCVVLGTYQGICVPENAESGTYSFLNVPDSSILRLFPFSECRRFIFLLQSLAVSLF